MKILPIVLCTLLLPLAVFAGDLAETGDLAPSPDVSYSLDPFAGMDPVTGKRRTATPMMKKRSGESIMRQQQDVQAQQGAQQVYQQNSAAAATPSPQTITIPAGTITGITQPMTITVGQ